jgi:hypothetical protein
MGERVTVRRWPPILWPLVALASLLILMGLSSWDSEALIPGGALALTVVVIAVVLATRRDAGRPRPRGVLWAIAGVAAFYVVAVAVAAVAGAQYAAVAVPASFFPLAAASLLLATTREKSTRSDRRPDDVARAHEDASLPGIGMDSETPLGDTPEHSHAERVTQPDRRFGRDDIGAGRR